MTSVGLSEAPYPQRKTGSSGSVSLVTGELESVTSNETHTRVSVSPATGEPGSGISNETHTRVSVSHASSELRSGILNKKPALLAMFRAQRSKPRVGSRTGSLHFWQCFTRDYRVRVRGRQRQTFLSGGVWPATVTFDSEISNKKPPLRALFRP